MASTLTPTEMAKVEEVEVTNTKDIEMKAYMVDTMMVMIIITNRVTFTVIIVVKLTISSVTVGFLNYKHIQIQTIIKEMEAILQVLITPQRVVLQI